MSKSRKKVSESNLPKPGKIIEGIAIALIATVLFGIYRIDRRLTVLETRIQYDIERRLTNLEEKIQELTAVWQETKDSIIIPNLISSLNDKDSAVKISAAKVLAEIADSRAVNPLIMALNDDNVNVRKYAIKGLTKLGDPRAITPLERVSQNDRDEGVRKAATESLLIFRTIETPDIHEGKLFTSKYSFTEGTMGWMPLDQDDSRACVRVLHSDDISINDRYSLKLQMNLIGGDTHMSKGGAWVNMLENPPSGETIPVDLTNRTITAWVYAPYGSRGDLTRPNGFQLFVKDENGKSEYGPWRRVSERQWFQVLLTANTHGPLGGSKDQSFDPSKIVALGIVIGSGLDSASMYEGVVYIDAIGW